MDLNFYEGVCTEVLNEKQRFQTVDKELDPLCVASPTFHSLGAEG